MKVLYITHVAVLGGANKAMLQLINDLPRDIKPIVLLPQNGIFCETLKENGIDYKISKFYESKQKKRSIISYLKCFFNLFFLIKLYFLFKNEKINIIHSNSSVINAGAFLSVFLKTKHIWHLREFGDLDFKLKAVLGTKIQNYIYNNYSDKIVAISQAVKTHYLKGIKKEKIQLIYDGVTSIPEFYISCHKNAKIQFCCTSMVAPGKNQMIVLKAVNLLVNHLKVTNFKVSFWGRYFEKDDYYKSLITYMEDNRICDFIEFKGLSQNLINELKFMDVGLTPSKCEAFGLVTIEYMLHQLPVIASNTGANIELIKNAHNGYLYNNEKELANFMQSFIKDQKLVIKMGIKARELALKKFSSEKNADSIYSLYLTLDII